MVISALKKITKYIDMFMMVVSVAGFLGIIVTVAAGIIARNVPIFTALPWTEELATFLFIIIAFCGGSCSAYRKREIIVDYFISKMPDKALWPLKIISNLLILIFMVMVFIGAILLQPRIPGVSVALGIPRNWYYIPILIASASIALIYFVALLDMFFPGKAAPDISPADGDDN